MLSNFTGHAQGETKENLLLEINAIRNNTSKSKQSENYVDLLNELAKKYRYRWADSIKILSDEAFLISSKINYQRGKAYALLRKGDYYSDTGKEQKAFDAYQEVKTLSYSLEYPKLRVEILKSIATHEQMSENLNSAVLTSYEAIEIASNNKLYELEARLRHNLGYAYSKYKLFDEAQIEYLIADSLWNQLENTSLLKAMTTSNIGLNSIEKGDLAMGERYLNQSLGLIERENQPLWLSRNYRTKSRLYSKKNQFKVAQKWIIKSDSILQKISNPRDQMEVDFLHTNILINLGAYKEAKDLSKKTLGKAMEFKDSLLQVQIYHNLVKIEEFQGNTEMAYSFSKTANEIQNLLNSNNEVQNIVLLRAKMNFEKEKETIRLATLKETLTQQKYMQWILGALLTTVFIAVLVYFSQRREKKLNKKLEEKTSILITNENHLKEINTNQKKLFSIVGHDLKGPISSLRALLRIMGEEENKERLTQNLLPKLNKYTDHVYFTIDNLLSWGEKQMKGENTDPKNIDLHGLTTQIIELFADVIEKKSLTINMNIGLNAKVFADINDIKVIFRNIINNAIKFSHPKGQITIDTKTDKNEVIISFEDKGIGMNPVALKKVLELNRFYSTPGTANEKGSGMGLMLSRELLSRNNGKLKVTSSEGQGSTFHIYLPKASSV